MMYGIHVEVWLSESAGESGHRQFEAVLREWSGIEVGLNRDRGFPVYWIYIIDDELLDQHSYKLEQWFKSLSFVKIAIFRYYVLRDFPHPRDGQSTTAV